MDTSEALISRIEALLEKGNKVIGTYSPSGIVIGAPDVDGGLYAEWKSQSLSFLHRTLGSKDVYVRQFESSVESTKKYDVEEGRGILRAVMEDIKNNYLIKVQTLVASEIFSNFLEQAQHLLDNGYKNPAASLVGGVLENGLRKIGTIRGTKIKDSDDISILNHKLADSEIYTRLIQNKIQVWNNVRNNADHGHFDQYSEMEVKEMLKGVQDFLGNYMSL